MKEWQKFAIYALIGLALIALGFFICRSTTKEHSPQLTVSTQSQTTITPDSITFAVKDSGIVKPQPKKNPIEFYDPQFLVPPEKPDTTIYQDTLSGKRNDSITVNGKRYKVGFQYKVPHKLTVIDKVGSWVAELIGKFDFPVIQTETSKDTLKQVVNIEYVSKPFFLDQWFWADVITTVVFIISLIFH